MCKIYIIIYNTIIMAVYCKILLPLIEYKYYNIMYLLLLIERWCKFLFVLFR